MSDKCDFCNKEPNQGVSLVYSHGSCICGECLELCKETFEEDKVVEFKDCLFDEKDDGLLYCQYCGRSENEAYIVTASRHHQICHLCTEYIMRFLNGSLFIKRPSSIENAEHLKENKFDYTFEELFGDILGDAKDDKTIDTDKENEEDFLEYTDEEDNLDTKEYKFFVMLCDEANCKLTKSAERKVKDVLRKKTDPGNLFAEVRLNQVSRIMNKQNPEYDDYNTIEESDIPNI